MIEVTKEAVKQIKDELENLKTETEINDPYIRLYMTYG